MLLNKLGKRGVAMTEYAILLAFVAAVAGSFTSDNGLASSIKDAVGKAENAINLAMGKEQNTNNYRYNVAMASEDSQYNEFINALINNLYDKMNLEPNNPPENVWIHKDGTISGYSVYNDENNKNGGYRSFDTPIKVTDLLPENSNYITSLNQDSHIYFDRSGNIIGSGSNWGQASYIYIANTDPSKNTEGKNTYQACVTFNQQSNTFGSAYDYWKY